MALSLVPYDIFKSLKGKGFRKGKWDGKFDFLYGHATMHVRS